jgi:hypothetical protein
MEKRLLFDGIALHAGGVSPWRVKLSASVKADFTDSGLPLRNGTAMAAGKTTQTVIFELLVKRITSFADPLIEHFAQRGHGESVLILALQGERFYMKIAIWNFRFVEDF